MGLAGTDGTSPPIRAAATIILLRGGPDGPRVLMGQRGAGAAFMPSKFVFPGGAMDPCDAHVAFACDPPAGLVTQLGVMNGDTSAHALCAAAIRELWEETGLALGQTAPWPDPPAAWAGFAALGLRPDPAPLRLIFRAITPPGRQRRFDARFFLVDAAHLPGDPDDFAAASDELAYLQWVTVEQARRLDLPFVTEVVLAEIVSLCNGHRQDGVPFFDNSGTSPRFHRLA